MDSRPPLQDNTNVRLVVSLNASLLVGGGRSHSLAYLASPQPDTPNTSKEHAPAGDGEPRDGSNMLCEQSGLAVCGELGEMRNVDREKRREHSSMVTNEAYSLPKENFEEGSSHASSLVPSTALPRPLLLSSIADSREERSSDRKTARPRKAAQILPLEVWAKILSHLNRNEKVDHTRTCRMFGDIVEDELYREVELDTDTVMSWTAGVTRYTHRAKTMRTLEISLEGASKDSLRDILPHLRKALCALPALQEFSLLDVQGLPEDAAEDILEGVQFSLTQFACDSDALIVKSWASLKKQIHLEEFRGLLDYTRVLQDDMTPDVFPELWLLETSSSFANRITNASTVTNLSIWTAYHQAQPTLARVTMALGENLSRLKITRHMMSSPNPYIGYTFAPQNSLPFRAWEAHSPIVLCEAIRAPNLLYFENVCRILGVAQDTSPPRRTLVVYATEQKVADGVRPKALRACLVASMGGFDGDGPEHLVELRDRVLRTLAGQGDHLASLHFVGSRGRCLGLDVRKAGRR
ncbi:hypothetical protein GY45DRAFT_87495 [Cubamyces sp. BRFM 1775]|nr:hypothetical protein GY45DRAFT_87495 [Cubamyces sp. BRFM 1775]